MTDRTVLSNRLIDIIFRLMSGETLNIKTIAEQDYHVSEKTIRRDLFERLNMNARFFELEYLENKRVRLRKEARPIMDHDTLGHFTQVMGMNRIISTKSTNVLRQIQNINSSYRMKQIKILRTNSQNCAHHAEIFTRLQQAIAERQIISIHYTIQKTKIEYTLHPYRLLFDKTNIWYLTAAHLKKIKNFCLEDIIHVSLTGNLFEPDHQIIDYLGEYNSVWQTQPGQPLQKATIFVARDVARYFIRQQHFPDQKIIKEDERGNLILSTQFRFNIEIFPVIRSWIPHLQILEPIALQTVLENEIKTWLIQQQSAVMIAPQE